MVFCDKLQGYARGVGGNVGMRYMMRYEMILVKYLIMTCQCSLIGPSTRDHPRVSCATHGDNSLIQAGWRTCMSVIWVIIASGNGMAPIQCWGYWLLNHRETVSVKPYSKYNSFHSPKCTWKCRLQIDVQPTQCLAWMGIISRTAKQKSRWSITFAFARKNMRITGIYQMVSFCRYKIQLYGAVLRYVISMSRMNWKKTVP